MAIHQHQVSFSAFAFSVAAQSQQSAARQVRTRSKTRTTVPSFQQPSLALRAGDGSSACTPPVIAVHPAAPVVAHGVDGGECHPLHVVADYVVASGLLRSYCGGRVSMASNGCVDVLRRWSSRVIGFGC